MKSTLHFLLYCIIILSSCAKKDNPPSTTTDPQVKFSANGQQYTFTGAADNPTMGAGIVTDFKMTSGNTVVYPGDYTLLAFTSDPRNYLRIGFLQIPSSGNALVVGTYTKSNFNCDTRLADKNYSGGVTYTVTITGITNNKYSGTFSATLKESSSTNTIAITDGTFQNLSYIP